MGMDQFSTVNPMKGSWVSDVGEGEVDTTHLGSVCDYGIANTGGLLCPGPLHMVTKAFSESIEERDVYIIALRLQ